MRIAMVSAPWYPVPPEGYGGIEAVVHLLASELHLRGHEVTVFAREGSRGDFELVMLADETWTGDLGGEHHAARESTYLHRVYEEIASRDFEVVHEHSGFGGIVLASTLSCAVVATMHGPLAEADAAFLAQVQDRVALVAISASQAAQSPGLNWAGVVHHAVDSSQLEVCLDKEDYLLELARICPDKGQHLAIEVARRLGIRLVLAGKVDSAAADQEYFEAKIKPHLGQDVEWIEDTQGADKAKLLARARAMLFPIQWEEPFGLVMVEAMVSGTPVIATPRGAAEEVVEPGLTGFLAGDVDGFVEAYGRIGDIDPELCAAHARDRFHPRRMADGYERVYEAALATKR